MSWNTYKISFGSWIRSASFSFEKTFQDVSIFEKRNDSEKNYVRINCKRRICTMDKLQTKYNLLHILYWITSCAIYGYVAVFLQYKGLTNTEIGIVTGGGSVISIFASPFITSLITRIKGLTIKKLTLILYAVMFGDFLCLTILPLPTILIMGLYIILSCLMVSIVPFLSMICMDFLKTGHYINFGLSRGMGSVSYAVSAVVLGQLVEKINPNILAPVFILFGILLLVLLFSMPDSNVKRETTTKSISTAAFIKKYQTFFLILFGFSFAFAASTSLSTYLINIVKNLGGDTSFYGIAIFAMAASEMPVMSMTHSLLKKYKAETLLLVAAFCYILRNFTISFAPNIFILLIGMMCQSVSYGLFTAVITYYVNDHVHAEDQMMGQTMIGIMTTGIGSTIGNVLGGILQDTFGLSSMLVFACLMTFTSVIVVFMTLIPKMRTAKQK